MERRESEDEHDVPLPDTDGPYATKKSSAGTMGSGGKHSGDLPQHDKSGTGGKKSARKGTSSTKEITKTSKGRVSLPAEPSNQVDQPPGKKTKKKSKEGASSGSRKSAKSGRTGTKENTRHPQESLSPKNQENLHAQPEPSNQREDPETVFPTPEPVTHGMTTRMNYFAGEIERLNQRLAEASPSPKEQLAMQKKATEKDPTAPAGKEIASRKASKSNRKIVFIGVFVVLLLCVTLAGLKIYKHYQKRLSERKMIECITPICKRIQEKVEEQLDKNIHPCDNFYGYVCKKWAALPRGLVPKGFLDDVFEMYDHTLVASLTSPNSKKPDKYGLHVMATLFDVCRGYMTSKEGTFEDAVPLVIDLLQLEDLRNRTGPFEFLLHMSLKNNIHSVFRVRFSRSGKVTHLLFDRGYSIHAKIFQIVRDSAADTSNDTMFQSEVMKPMIAKLLKDSRINSRIEPDNIIQTDVLVHQLLYAKSADRKYWNFSEISRLASEHTAQTIVDAINKVVPSDFKVGLRSPVEVVGLNSLLRIRSLLANEEVRRTYHIVNLASGLLSFTAYKNMAKESPALVPFMCLRATRIALTNTWPFLVARLVGHFSSGTTAGELATRIRNLALAETVFEGFDTLQRKSGKDILKSTTLFTYDGEELSALESTDYTSWRLKGTEAFSVFVEAGKKEREMLYKSYALQEVVKASKNQLTKRLKFTERDGFLTVPTAYQNPPLFYYEEVKEIPYYINDATLGACIAKEMVRALTARFKPSNRTTRSFEESLKCAKKVAAAQGLSAYTSREDLRESEAVMWYYAFRILYDGVRRTVTKAGESLTGPVWRETQRYFFIRFCMLACTNKDEDSSGEFPVHFKERCLVPVLSNADFATHFGCTGRLAFKTDQCVSEQR
ncbi:uncharacterized protein LOC135366197 [Ornithodoros turicata]|uniref:uncharacterized protein LOC135366197 n=1 Tax=Ornithodoros turicata TaxID=34597 RepID=UPI0031394C5C